MSTPVLPDWFPRRELSRPTAEQITRAENRKGTLTYAGPNAVIPIVYGEQLVGGPIIAGPVIDGGNLVWAVGICYAGASGIEDILDCRVGDSIVNFTSATVVNSGISVTRALGGGTTPNSTLVSAIPGFDDVFQGVAYIVCSTPADNVTSMPQVTVRVRGRRCPTAVPPKWISTNLPFPVNDLGSYAADTAIIAVGNSGALATSTDWNTWTTRTSQFGTSDILALGSVGSVNVIVGADGKIATSGSSGASWTLQTSGVTDRLNAISRNSGVGWAAGGENGTVLSGRRGGSPLWVSNTITSTFGASEVTAAAHLGTDGSIRSFYAGEDGKYQSGTTSRDIGFGSSSIRCLAILDTESSNISGSNPIVAVGDDGKCARSSNGTTSWELVDAGFGSANITHLVSAGGQYFIALSDDGQVRASEDGISWWEVNAPSGARQLFFARGHIVIIDDAGQGWRVNPDELYPVRWTENPVLHMLDFVTNDEFGMGVNLIGAEAAAAVADSLYSGLPRSRTGLTIQDSMTEEDVLALFAQYAEVLWSYDGRDVVIIPDAPVDTVHEIDADAIIGDSINLTTVGLEQVPTQIRLMFSDREEPTWASRPAVAEVPEHTMHGMPTSPSTVPLPGVFNRIEAERRAWQRLMRLQSPGRLEWQMTAPGMPYQAGDVVRLPDRRGLQSVDVRLTAQPTMIAPLKYQMVGEIYSQSHYPTGAGGTAVPEGAIMILRGSGSVPDGWQAFNMGGRLLKEGAPGNAGSLSSVSITGLSLAPAGAHLGTRIQGFQVAFYVTEGRSTYRSTVDEPEHPPHTHSVGAISFQADQAVPKFQARWIKKIDGPALPVPGICFLAGGEISAEGWGASSGATNRYLSGGTQEQTINAVSSAGVATSKTGQHAHGNNTEARIVIDEGSPSVTSAVLGMSGYHDHYVSASITSKFRSMAMTIFESFGDSAIPTGAIVGWEGATAPAGWAFCDGDNGTIDLRDRFIYLTSAALAGQEHEPENVLSATVGGNTSFGGAHGHDTRTVLRAPMGTITLGHHGPGVGGHSHAVIGDLERTYNADTIIRYQLRFIQYVGE